VKVRSWGKVLAASGVIALVTAGAYVAGSAVAGQAPAATGPLMPSQVFAPYFESYLPNSPATLAKESGTHYLILAFLQTPKKGSCTVDWNGLRSTPVSSSVYGAAIARIRARGGNVAVSFGGYSADHGGTDIADSCTSVAKIAAAYEHVVLTYDLTRVDLDTEDNSLTDVAGINRRNAAIHLVEEWAAARHRTVQFVYTIPTNVTGIGSNGLRVLRSAKSHDAKIDVVNIMTFDYYIGTKQQMATDTKKAANSLHRTLHRLYPKLSALQLWQMIGVTEMVGIDDYGPDETFTSYDGYVVERWAASRHLGELSFWALQRDNGGCPRVGGSNTCSGLKQKKWGFSHDFERFTRAGV
jgi:Glycosyl hydrolases family 18